MTDNWDRPDEGIWKPAEAKKDLCTPPHVLGGVRSGRSALLATRSARPIAKWRESRDEIYHQIMERGFHDDMKAFVQHYETDVLDASVLKMPLTGFISPERPTVAVDLGRNQREHRVGFAGVPLQPVSIARWPRW